jgi:hypothetical protein
MPKVTMLAKISGTRDGEDWPARGETLEVSADEAAALVANGLAVAGAVKEAASVDTSEVETATVKPARGRKA